MNNNNSTEKPIDIIEEYDEMGFLVKLTANGVDLPVPKQEFPEIYYYKDVDWKNIRSITQKKYYTKEKFKKL